MLRWAQSPRFDVLKSTPSLVDFSAAWPLGLFEQPAECQQTIRDRFKGGKKKKKEKKLG